MLIGFAIIVNDSSHNFIRQIQVELNQELGFRISRQSPHVTIKTPFEVEEIEPLTQYLENLAKEIQPFPIRLKGFGYFGEQVIFLDVEEKDSLNQLHWRILNDLKEEFAIEPHQFEGDNVKFHASVAGYSDPEDFQNAQNYLKRYQPDFQFQATTLGIFYHLGNDGWVVYRKISL